MGRFEYGTCDQDVSLVCNSQMWLCLLVSVAGIGGVMVVVVVMVDSPLHVEFKCSFISIHQLCKCRSVWHFSTSSVCPAQIILDVGRSDSRLVRQCSFTYL